MTSTRRDKNPSWLGGVQHDRMKENVIIHTDYQQVTNENTHMNSKEQNTMLVKVLVYVTFDFCYGIFKA